MMMMKIILFYSSNLNLLTIYSLNLLTISLLNL